MSRPYTVTIEVELESRSPAEAEESVHEGMSSTPFFDSYRIVKAGLSRRVV